MGKKIICLIVLLFICGLMINTAGAKGVIVTFKDKPDTDIIKPSGKIKHTYQNIPAVAADLPDQVIEDLKKNDKIAYIEPDVEVKALEDTQTIPWGIRTIGARHVQIKNNNYGTGINVAVIDTGIDYNHPDLNSTFKGGYDFVNNDADPIDDNGHGTHCAGIIAAQDNTLGVVGVAPQAYLYSYKVLDSSGSGYTSNVIAAIDKAIQTRKDKNPSNDIQIISMSLGSNQGVKALQLECSKAYNSGILLVAAAGNSGTAEGTENNVNYPAAYSSSVIAVAATDSKNVRPRWSSTGPEVELSAPGVDISSTYLGNGYATISGTSMACPHVAGTAALVKYKNPSFTNINIRNKLDQTATDLGIKPDVPDGKDNWYGYGLVNAYKAVNK